MADFAMKDNKLIKSDGDFELVEGLEETQQHIIVALNTFYKDWILDYTKGIDYAYGLRNLEFLEYDIQKQIKGVFGVRAINDFSLKLDRTTMNVKITAHINTVNGNFDLNETIKLK